MKMDVLYYVLNHEVRLIIVDDGYILEIGNYQFDRFINDYRNREEMIINALTEIVLGTEEYYDDVAYHRHMILPRIEKLKSELID